MPAPEKIIYAGEIQPDPGWHMPAHFHPFEELILVLSGTMKLRTPRKEYAAKAGDLLFYHAGLVHEETSAAAKPVHTLFVSFTSGRLPARFPLVSRDTEGRVRELMSWLLRDVKTGRGEGEWLVSAIVNELLRLDRKPMDPWLVEVRVYMQDNHAASLALDELADWAKMSPHAFLRKYKRLSGHTPMADLRLMRLNEARHHILTSPLPLKAIAPLTGLGDEFQLSKLFRRHFGLSPGAMRAKSTLS